MTVASSIWSGIGNAKLWDEGKYMEPGFKGRVRVKRTIAKSTRKGSLGFIVEMEIVDSNMPEHHAVGSKATWFQTMTDTSIAFPEVAKWAGACFGMDPTDKERIEEEVMPHLEGVMNEATASPDKNVFTDIELFLETWNKKTLKGGDFTKHKFTPTESA